MQIALGVLYNLSRRYNDAVAAFRYAQTAPWIRAICLLMPPPSSRICCTMRRLGAWAPALIGGPCITLDLC